MGKTMMHDEIMGCYGDFEANASIPSAPSDNAETTTQDWSGQCSLKMAPEALYEFGGSVSILKSGLDGHAY
jgi:hypothetical protein